MKMCKYYNKNKINYYGGHCENKENPCPDNTNNYCEIIIKEPKMVKVKAWGRFIFCGTQSLKTLQAQSIKKFQCQDKKVFNFDIPCTILIDEKYLKSKEIKK